MKNRAMQRLHLYISHSFAHDDGYERILEIIREEGFTAADYSVPLMRQIQGDEDEVLRGISERIRCSNRVIVLATERIHKSPYIDFEIRVAHELGKPIIVVKPHGQLESPIPRTLDERFYRVVGWRRDTLGKALRLEYPPDRRVFAISEIEDRRAIVESIGLAVGAVAFVLAGVNVIELGRLERELEEKGCRITDKGPSLLESTLTPTLVGVGFGAILGWLIGKSDDAALSMAVIGGGIGAATGLSRHYRMRIEMLGSLAKLELQPVSGV